MSIRRTLGMVAVGAIAAAAASAAPFPELEQLFGPSDVAAIAGNGGLTIGINHSGRITSCRWPSPGYYDQLTYQTESRMTPAMGVPPSHGIAWAIAWNGRFAWLHDDRWIHSFHRLDRTNALVVRSAMADFPFRVEQTFFVHPEMDVMVTQLRITGMPLGATPPTIQWYANFTPCTRYLPQLPLADSALDPLNDFAAYADAATGTITHFRPRQPSSHDWRLARTIALSGEPTNAWSQFSEGTWITYGSPDQVVKMACGPDTGSNAVHELIGAGMLRDAGYAVGQTASAIELEPRRSGDHYVATVVAAFGATNAASRETFQNALNRGAEAMAEDAQNAFPSNTPVISPESPLQAMLDYARKIMFLCTDRATGSVVRAPIAQPPLAVDRPRDGALIAFALDLAGEHDRASRLLQFYAAAVRTKPVGSAPEGSLPFALYSSGESAAPSAILDAAAVGWVLWAMDRHATALDGDAQAVFLESIWDSVDLMAEFLVSWRESGGRDPLYSFDGASLRDEKNTDLYVASYLGMRAAVRMATSMNGSRPIWTTAADELRAALHQHALNAEGAFQIAEPEVLWDTGLLPGVDDAAMDPLASNPARIDDMSSKSGDLLRMCRFVMVNLDNPSVLLRRKSRISGLIRQHLNEQPPDALDAALAFITLHHLAVVQPETPPIEEPTPETP